MKRTKGHSNIRFSTGLFSGQEVFRKVMPFRRSWKAIFILALFDIAFLIPAIFTFNSAYEQWSHLDTLFELVSALFLSAWLLGWSIAPLIMTIVLVILVFGREVLLARPGSIEIGIGIPGLMGMAEYQVSKMRNLRAEIPEKKSGKSWRGPHMVFDYDGGSKSFGSDINDMKAANLINRLVMATGSAVRSSMGSEQRTAPVEKKSREELVNKLSTLLVQKVFAMPATSAAGISSEEDTEEDTEEDKRGQAANVFTFSTLFLILANLVPVAGALYFGWDLDSILVIYWAESAVIGFYNLCKILVIGGWPALFSGIFFISHFGAFMAIHFLFLYHFFIQGIEATSPVELEDVAILFSTLWPALAALFISHGISFIQNFVGHQEYRNKTVGMQMYEPYQRIIFMHLVIIFSAGLMLMTNDSTVVLLLVIVAKIVVDIRAHIRERSSP